MPYIDGFVIAVPTANKQKFIEHAKNTDSVFLELGALRVLECWGDDVPDGKQTDFRRAVQAKPEETVVFSWVEWPDKPTRDAAMVKMMQDDRFSPEKNPMPFDGARMIFGGFDCVLALEKQQGNKVGDFVWYELLTTDAAAAQDFYAKILGWHFASSGQPDVDYRIINAGEHSIGGLMALTAQMLECGGAPAWLGYIAVDDVDAAVTEMQKRGGSVQMEAMDVPMAGRLAMVADPQGVPFYVIKPQGTGKSLAFADDRPRVGHCAWNELQTPDQAAAWKFYGQMFGWKQAGDMDMGTLGKYEFIQHGSMLGAIMPNAATGGSPRWNQYFRVDDIDLAKDKVIANGGKVTQGPDPIPGGDFSMNCVDPQGAPFGLVGARKSAA